MPVTARFGLRAHDALNRRDALKGVSDADIGMAQATGFDAEDIEALRLFCNQHLMLLTIRCPKGNTRHAVGHRAPKPASAKGKSDEDGLGQSPGQSGPLFWVSDYDLMGVFEFARGTGGRYSRIVTTKPVRPGMKPEMTGEFRPVFQALNACVRHSFQHGANDDYVDTAGKVLNDSEELWGSRYVAFMETGQTAFIPSFGHLQNFYLGRGLDWPYGTRRPQFLRGVK
jgi:hypothetical protein